uniref:CCAAT enhancer binding protein delta n=1 Tax=Crocodylus porosus TaxID=8502 RepID=A0A7M4FA63_CROPO
MSAAAALHSLEPATCYRHWALEPATLYDAKAGSGGGCKGGRAMSAEEAAGGGSSCSLAELSAAAPAMYEDESAIDFSSYIDSMAAVPNLELCNDELFADLFNSNHKPERAPLPSCSAFLSKTVLVTACTPGSMWPTTTHTPGPHKWPLGLLFRSHSTT